jgi:hypothetical protein
MVAAMFGSGGVQRGRVEEQRCSTSSLVLGFMVDGTEQIYYLDLLTIQDDHGRSTLERRMAPMANTWARAANSS